jgi:hypothetical protein
VDCAASLTPIAGLDWAVDWAASLSPRSGPTSGEAEAEAGTAAHDAATIVATTRRLRMNLMRELLTVWWSLTTVHEPRASGHHP